MPEELAFQQMSRDGPARDVDEHVLAANAVVVHELGEQSLARAGLAQQDHPRVARSRLLGDLEHGPDRRTVPDELREALRTVQAAPRRVLAPEAELVDGAAKGVLNQGGLDRFPQVVEGAQLHGLDAVVIVRLSREDDHLARPPGVADPAEGLESPEPRHAEVEEDHVKRVLRQALEGLLAAPDAVRVMTRRGETLSHHEPEVFVVVHDEHAHRAALLAHTALAGHDSAGSQNTTVVPRPGPGLDTSILPRCCSMSD